MECARQCHVGLINKQVVHRSSSQVASSGIVPFGRFDGTRSPAVLLAPHRSQLWIILVGPVEVVEHALSFPEPRATTPAVSEIDDSLR